jgi:hypothetical protein
MIFEDLPLDDEIVSSIDDSDGDETYFPWPDNDTILVMKFDSDSDENVDILNNEENVAYIYILHIPSPHRTRSSRRNHRIKIIKIKKTHYFFIQFF